MFAPNYFEHYEPLWDGASLTKFPQYFALKETKSQGKVVYDVHQLLSRTKSSHIGKIVFSKDKNLDLEFVNNSGKVLARATRERYF